MKENKNISSGAEKVENIQKNAQKKQSEQAEEVKQSAQNALKEKNSPKKSESSGAKKSETASAEEKTSQKNDLQEKKNKEQSAAAKRATEAKKAHAKKVKIKDEKQERKEERQKRKQMLKERRLELKEERKARRDMLKSESKEERAERIAAEKQAKLDEKQKKREHALELKEQRAEERAGKREARMKKAQNKREHALELKEQRQREKEAKREHRHKEHSHRREHAPGFGGWLAAVIALGVSTLALGSIVTYGYFAMNDMAGSMIYSYQNDLYELNSVTDNVDYTLAKLSVSGTKNEQIKLLNEVVTQSDVALSSLERLPVNYNSVSNLTKFVSDMKTHSQNLLKKLYSGQKLDERDQKAVLYMYNTNAKIRSALNELMGKIEYADFVDLMKQKKNGAISGAFDDMQNNSFTNELQQPPFALNNEKVSESFIESMEEISSTYCEEKARGYFENYNIKTVEVKGETQNKGVSCYNVKLRDDRDREYYAQISKKGGLLVMFDSFEHCEAHNFDKEQCIDIASKFLEKAGYTNLTPVWINDFGATCEINFVTECDGALVYSEMIKVNVCETRGKVTAMDAQAYVKNHKPERTVGTGALTMSDCKNMLMDGMEIVSSAKAVIPFEGKEKLAYEFISNVGGRTYYIYTDATTGEEIEIFVVQGSAYGNSLR